MYDASVSWPALLALGAGHGINPAMGWLFAVALALQHESRRALWAALMPLAVGHALAISAAIVIAGVVGTVVPLGTLRPATAGLLVGFGLYRLARSTHPRYGGMQVGFRELAIWSFLVASAHGAGLMVLPLVLGQARAAPPAGHLAHAGLLDAPAADWSGLAAAAVHTAGYLLTTALIAGVVYERVGLRFLRAAWVNLDLVWALALVLTGAAMVVG